jgi:hypothetical protein
MGEEKMLIGYGGYRREKKNGVEFSLEWWRKIILWKDIRKLLEI